ncbi:hypothetical protein PV327_005323 [Microctonus hyperodae]|uniref:Uncharacterized protein n=1 Tax=Microctonus hyperodae TaxID=165561 RepID=A0AA39G2J7_MICHY|nr:hypothetical protein PV327_005323 [Microctonus hyperodae]
MNYLNFILLLSFGVSMVTAASRYIAIPIDNIDIIEVNPIAPSQRVSRQTEAYVPLVISNRPELENQEPRIERSSPILDYVDFGSQTGANGAFSWYADYPAHH